MWLTVREGIGYGNYLTYSIVAMNIVVMAICLESEFRKVESLGKCGTTGSIEGNYLHFRHLTCLGQPHAEPERTLGL